MLSRRHQIAHPTARCTADWHTRAIHRPRVQDDHRRVRSVGRFLAPVCFRPLHTHISSPSAGLFRGLSPSRESPLWHFSSFSNPKVSHAISRIPTGSTYCITDGCDTASQRPRAPWRSSSPAVRLPSLFLCSGGIRSRRFICPVLQNGWWA